MPQPAIWTPSPSPSAQRRRDADADAAVEHAAGDVYSTYDARTMAPYIASGHLNHGGLVNPVTGQGTARDRTEFSGWMPTRLNSGNLLEVVYAQSWACRKYIDIPVDDMTVRWREFDDADAGAPLMTEEEERLQVRERLTDAMKAARLYGTALLVLVTANQTLAQPLIPEAVQRGDLLNLIVVDRFHARVREYDTNIYSPTYAEPLTYEVERFAGTHGALLEGGRRTLERVHRSRVIRFDGIRPMVANRWAGQYDRDWGVSMVVPAMKSIIDDHRIAAGAAYMADEASVPVMKIQGMGEGLAAQQRTRHDPDALSPEQLALSISDLKSIYRTIFLDAADDFDRVNVSWAGLGEVMNQFARRLAALAGVPATRFWGQSPVGMNATGESDMANYAIHVQAMQKQTLAQPLKALDAVLARNIGIEPLDYHFPSLMDLSEIDKAQVSQVKATAVQTAIMSGVISEDDGRAVLDGDDTFGELGGPAPGPPMLEPGFGVPALGDGGSGNRDGGSSD